MNNVVDDFGSEYNLTEGSYLEEVFSILKEKLKGFNYYLFVIYDHYGDNEYVSATFDHPRKILIHRGGEGQRSRLENLKKSYFHIFANYYWECENLTQIPLGYHSSLGNEVERVSISERIYNLNFIGAISRNRVDFAANLININSIWLMIGIFAYKEKFLEWINYYLHIKNNNDLLQFNSGFNNGIDQKEFANQLRLSKIVLCPKGFHNTETFRLYEAMQYGCVVITEELPKRNFYKNIPVFQVKNWKDGITLAKILLKDENLLEKLSISSRSWYENHFSPQATAKIMIDKINSIK